MVKRIVKDPPRPADNAHPDQVRAAIALKIAADQMFHVRPALPHEFAPRVVDRFGTVACWRTRWAEMIKSW